MELRTYRNVSVGSRLKAFDPDDDVVSYTITTDPVKGSIELEENGCFVYTPRENKRGRDYFGYKAVDSKGNHSQEATVIIRIEKQKKGVSYTDLEGKGCAWAATVLSESGIFTGERIGGSFCFSPERAVSRGEFLAMCLRLQGGEAMRAVMRTGYADDAAIPVWLKGCCAASRLNGTAPTEMRLDPLAPIQADEAAAWLARTLDLPQIRYMTDQDGATQTQCELSAYGIPAPKGNGTLTRAQAAMMFTAALALQE
ncbi:MAG: hypothetical protein J6P58_02090 [Oscillospiraceae bacterium]|nr:hypothetical protein [Oscillospiraceae bacterium]